MNELPDLYKEWYPFALELNEYFGIIHYNKYGDIQIELKKSISDEESEKIGHALPRGFYLSFDDESIGYISWVEKDSRYNNPILYHVYKILVYLLLDHLHGNYIQVNDTLICMKTNVLN